MKFGRHNRNIICDRFSIISSPSLLIWIAGSKRHLHEKVVDFIALCNKIGKMSGRQRVRILPQFNVFSLSLFTHSKSTLAQSLSMKQQPYHGSDITTLTSQRRRQEKAVCIWRDQILQHCTFNVAAVAQAGESVSYMTSIGKRPTGWVFSWQASH